ncbi:GlsB/YeaQ/YmgE family stress response membrane protein [Alkalimonas collagenimarina]|uniref:GlsB/YeaQ/YmgE family stress response membrane protein n=1 Tax=Alkalimonas collagenimarina TaxID=400390 RepID=A0ABT9GY18_9GAMM|nr:GlsB/YeaQ/YmgE family stress response membrane protein [Alkalimonas collagenimarina]MDP4535952.1 GlsB/YeaQ/YmgE family stress response membrane protein [Alkalimonas collagenimarina]
MNFIIFLLIGALAGWLAGQLMKGRGFGLIVNIIVGVVGSFIGGIVFNALGLGPTNLIGTLIMATIGAVVLLFLLSLISKKA